MKYKMYYNITELKKEANDETFRGGLNTCLAFSKYTFRVRMNTILALSTMLEVTLLCFNIFVSYHPT